jgi:hypothetical protein
MLSLKWSQICKLEVVILVYALVINPSTLQAAWPIHAVRTFIANADAQAARNAAQIKELESRLNEANSALQQGIAAATKDQHDAEIYFESSRKIAEVGIKLADGNPWNLPAPSIPLTNIDAIQIGQYATAVSAINQLKQGVDKMRSYEEFASAYLAGDYNKPIQALQAKIDECREKIAEIKPTAAEWRAYLARELSLVGTWVAPDGRELVFREDNTLLYSLHPGCTGLWELNGNSVSMYFNPQLKGPTLPGNSLLKFCPLLAIFWHANNPVMRGCAWACQKRSQKFGQIVRKVTILLSSASLPRLYDNVLYGPIHAEQGRAHNPRQCSPLCLPIPVG